MKISSTWFVLFVIGICRVAALETIYPADIEPLNNRNGWVNPEDLASMPQCIAQQDQSTWLSAITKCTSKICIRHFGPAICTHHQWLTQLGCLNTVFTPDVVKAYLPYCSRSVLAEAQLFQWIHAVTGRTWLVEVGDAIGLQTLSPASLGEGYAALEVRNKVPTCLADSSSASSMEPFQHVMASCGFTADAQHTGNAARPWEYNQDLRSIIALDSQTASYELTEHRIAHGDYFDKQCFCKAFGIDWKAEPCAGPGIALTRERLWLNATCGPTSLPDHWTDELKTTRSAYIPTEDWRWPECVAGMPKKVTGLADTCTTDACEVDSRGYCKIKRAIDRACFCRNISYNSCKGSCHVFETRIDYISWLHDLCGSEQGWHGLPKHWRQVAAPTPLDMIPWRWRIKPSKDLTPASGNHKKSSISTQTCTSPERKLGYIVLINMATILAGFLGPRATNSAMHRRSWFLTGLAIAAIYLVPHWLNAVLVQSIPGYEDVPIAQLVLLWTSMPRLTWLTVLLVGLQPLQSTSLPTAKSCLVAEMILQALSAYPMLTTVRYGREHSFYTQGMARLESSSSAQFMYAGALMWLLVTIVALALLLQATRRANKSATHTKTLTPKPQTCNHTQANIAIQLITLFNKRWTRLEDALLHRWTRKTLDPEQTPLMTHAGQTYTAYGTIRVKVLAIERATVTLYLIATISMFLLSIAQWSFWAGFIGLSLEEYCPPALGLLTVVWMVSSGAGGGMAFMSYASRSGDV
ncbi:hypothetical protein BDW02DRAFT_566653 [Decorospora gaudefroyi]|uniref:Extracellular membrane protein CFEM domain-containing protein n=1 Tax=Decorospora gaudefroyi TaxID=184978 RepID=A0A6A5KTB5_9PLEO|nr:hypothetical protein BDW02DRAFT_566653 [Decorospora gaudefroyi]